MGFLRFVVLGVAVAAVAPFAARAGDDLTDVATDAELVETRTEVPRLKAAAAYEMKDNVVEIELSEYAGYAGLVVANGGLDPSEESVFFKKHGFKVKLTLSEEESWSSLNSGRLAASATTVDVLAVYGRQFQVAVPALIGYSRGADGVVVRSDIRKINDLKGKVLSSAQFTEADFFIRYLAQEASIGVAMLPDLKAKPAPDRINLVYCADGFASGDLFLKDVTAGRNRLAGCVTWAPKTNEVADGSGGKANVLVTNRNLLIVADILVVNKGFAQAHGDIVQGLVSGLLEGNHVVRTTPDAHFATIAKAFKWEIADAKEEIAKVHVANFLYVPGDHTLTGSLGAPARVTKNETLRFINEDVSIGVRHSITSCKMPCNGDYVANYPNPDGYFDSGKMGNLDYIDGGLAQASGHHTLAGQEYDGPGVSYDTYPYWDLDTTDLDPGMYSYYCRIHAWMRGWVEVAAAS